MLDHVDRIASPYVVASVDQRHDAPKFLRGGTQKYIVDSPCSACAACRRRRNANQSPFDYNRSESAGKNAASAAAKGQDSRRRRNGAPRFVHIEDGGLFVLRAAAASTSPRRER
jgi:hypothetical protein